LLRYEYNASKNVLYLIRLVSTALHSESVSVLDGRIGMGGKRQVHVRGIFLTRSGHNASDSQSTGIIREAAKWQRESVTEEVHTAKTTELAMLGKNTKVLNGILKFPLAIH
jgi:hypothetical protein